MLLIGITGGIGAGKSIVSRILRLRGFCVYDCDSEAKRLMDSNKSLISRIGERFGEQCLLPDGKLNRAEIAKKVFSSEKDLAWLNSEVHQLVCDDIRKWTDSEERIKFVESAILRTSGLDQICDQIWLVEATEDVRVSRALSRGGIDEYDLRGRINSQRSEFEALDSKKIRVINNDGCYSVLKQLNLLISEF